MTAFLKHLANQLISKHSTGLDNVLVIIPNKRAAVYLQKYLSEKIGKAFFPPKITTINEWVDAHTPERILNQTELLFLFYKVYVNYDQDQSESFDEFLKWGKIILADFDEIDRYHIEPKDIFKDLKDIKDIDNWSFDGEESLSDGQLQFLNLWEKLPHYYRLLNESLNDQKSTYQGRAYQKFSKQCQLTTPGNYHHYYFAGFNALSKAEELMIDGLTRQKVATVFWDVDQHYVNHKDHEAGHFYRKIQQLWEVKETVPNAINSVAKQFHIVETAQQIAQAKYAGDIIKNLPTEELNQTAIVLADESLLIPLSRSLPAELERANITMGYPIKFSHLKSLIDIIFDGQNNAVKFSTDKLYHKTVLHFLDHPFIQQLIGDTKAIDSFEAEVVNKNKIYFTITYLTDTFPSLAKIESVFTPWKNQTHAGLSAIKKLIQTLYNSFKANKDKRPVELEIMYHFSLGIQKFDSIYSQFKYDLSVKSFKALLYQFWQHESLSFLGNPTEGIQIMGILETRTLDFKNLIILGMNEGNLPKNNFSNSLLMRELKLFHQLPVEEDRDAIFAHHFYRLLHQAENIHLTFNSHADGLTSGEKSRFITQLENELDRTIGHQITNNTYVANDDSATTDETVYKVNASVEQKLDALFARGLSPSALNTFLRCPLDFFYTYILNLREESEVEEAIEASTFGTMIHAVLETVFKQFFDSKTKVDVAILTAEKKKLESYLETEYLKVFSKSDLKYGQNKLSFDVSLTFLNKTIDEQIKELKKTDAPLYILGLEEDLETSFDWDINGAKKSIKIKGQADRIDQFGSSYRIIDYKSGKCDSNKVGLPAKVLKANGGGFESVFKNTSKSYGIQLLMYATMYRDAHPKKSPFTAGIVSMININQWLQNVVFTGRKEQDITDEILELFKEQLKETVTQMYNPDFEYKHDSSSDYCEFCGR
ncbi:MAG: PD-(D/E)XK nuclease family protein [Crocinitomicaceae bacterium]